MTKEEICKVLECCSSPEYRCNECPIDQKKKDDCECGTFGMGEALALIKELTEENKKLTINMNAYGLTAKRLSEENERLRADTVREMQKRLTNLFSNDENLEYIEVDAEYINEQIDQIANEMIGETK